MGEKDDMVIMMEYLQRSLWVAARGTTTSAGNVGGTTIIDTARTEAADFWNDHYSIIILDGANQYEIRQIIDNDGTDTLTVDRAFTAQVASGIGYIIRKEPYSAQGANSADNKFDSSAVTLNHDGSHLERLEGILVALGGTIGTTDDTGTTTTAIDSVRTEANDYWNGGIFVCVDGTNAGLGRPIYDFDATLDTLHFEPAFPNLVASGVEYIILNRYDTARMIGDNSGDNSYDSSLVDADKDGSLFERAEWQYDITGNFTGPHDGVEKDDNVKGLNDIMRDTQAGGGTVYFVGGGGADIQTGTSWSQRRLTVASGYGLCTAGDTLIVGIGVFTEDINFNTDGVMVVGAGMGDGTNAGTLITGHSTMTCMGNVFGNIHFTDADGVVVTVGNDANGNYNTFKKCTITGTGTATSAMHMDGTNGGDFNTFEDCFIAGGTASTILFDSGATISNLFKECIVQSDGTAGHGIHINHADADDNVFDHCIIQGLGSTGTGVYVQAGTENHFFECGVDDFTLDYSVLAANHVIGCHEESQINVMNTIEDDLSAIYSVAGVEGGDMTSGTTYFVGKAGNDGNDGLSWPTRRLTIASGYGLCSNGDILVVGPGAFTEDLALDTDGVTVIGAGIGDGTNDGTMISGTATITAGGNVFKGFYFYDVDTAAAVVVIGNDANSSYNKFFDCRFEASGTSTMGLHIDGTAGGINNVIKNCIFYNGDTACLVADGGAVTGTTIKNCWFHMEGHGIHFNNAAVADNLIKKCHVNGNGTANTGIYIQAGADNHVVGCSVDDCTTLYNIAANNYSIGCHEGFTDINGTSSDTYDDIFQTFATLWAADGANTFNPTIDGVARTDLETALEALSGMITEIGGMSRFGTVSTANTAANFKIAELLGYGDSFFNTDWVMVCIHNADNDGNAPESEIRDISAYTSVDGDFTVAAFSVAPTNGDEMMVARREFFITDGVALQTIPATNSLAYRLSQFIATGDGDFAGSTPLASNKSLVDTIGTDGSVAISHEFSEESLLQYLHGFHSEAVILFVIPEAVGSINAHNSAILTELQKCGEVITITQADALAYPDFEGISICVLGTDNGTAWVVANLAHIKVIPDLPLLCCDATAAAYFEIGTDGGDAAAKTAINAIANIKGSILGMGLHDITGLAVGANTVSSAATYNTLDMSDADLTETWYAYETDNANTDVVLGEVRRVQPDGGIGIDETGAEVPATMSFYGCAYSANNLNTLGKATLQLLAIRLIEAVTIGSTLTISGDVGNLETKILGNMTTKHSNAVPLAAFISGNSGGTGTELPNSVSLYDVTGGFSGDGGAAQDDSIKASLDLAHTDLDNILASVEPDLGGVALYGIVTTATSDTRIKVAGLAGKGTNAFIDRYYCHIIEADNAAPEGETRKISAYDTADGDITVGVAFSVAPDVGDQILILHESLALVFMHADATLTNVMDDSIIAHILAVDGTTADYNDNTMSLEALNTDLDAIIMGTISNAAGADVATDVVALQADIGNPSARGNFTTIEAMLGNPDAANCDLYGAIGDEYINGNGNPDVDNIRAHLRAGLVNGTGSVLPANKSLYDYHKRTKVNDSLAYDVSEIAEEAANADTQIISIDNATYPMFKIEKIFINIKGWHDVADAAETLNILMRLETDDAGAIGADDDLKIKTYTEGTDIENVIVIDDIAAGVDTDIYVYTGAAMDAGDDFTITWHYLITTIG